MNLTRDDVANREGRPEFDVHWHGPDPTMGTITAVLRVKNEARSIPWVLPGMLRAVDRVVLVDNGSDDGTPDLARKAAASEGAEDRLEVYDYPFSIGRCGPEHLSIPADSVHSLTHFYNWAFSHVRTKYGLKWDGDMVLTDDGVRYLRHLAWQVEHLDFIVRIPRYPAYVESDDVAYVDTTVKNLEPWAWPNKPGFFLIKAVEWELMMAPENTPLMTLPEWSCFELKWLDADEFSHWSEGTDFTATGRTNRKAREWEVFHAVRSGALPDGVVKVVSPGETHVIDHLRTAGLAVISGRS
jgi:glycosyltransferase involved in cell wall biosynthesis